MTFVYKGRRSKTMTIRMATDNETEKKVVTVTGIADCHGIESMREKKDCSPQDIFAFSLRSNLNRQRHAVFYEADLTPDTYEAIRAQLKTSNWEMALKMLKAMAVQIRTDKSHAKSWDLIPNPVLDPWR